MASESKWAMPTLVFFTSAAVLVLEILAGRLVAPYVGVSLETYTGIIGTVLAGIAAGSALGGAVADRHNPRPLLGPLLVLAGVASLLSLPIIAAVGPSVADNGGGPGGIVVLAVTAFVLPTLLLSAVSPMAAKLRLSSTAETGMVVGGLSAAGTAGALVGTFLTGFVFVAALPTRPVVIGVGALLIAAGTAMSVRRWVGLAALVAAVGLSAVVDSPCQRETVYFCASVVHDPGRPSGRVLMLDNLRHSYVDLEDPTYLEFRYTGLFAEAVDAAFGRAAPLRALHIGGGGFTFPRWLMATRPGTANVVLEIDPGVVDLAEDLLGLRTGPALRVRTGDARLSLAEERTDSYDVVVGDAFGGLSVPWHLTTTETIAEVARVLRPGGVYLLNVIDAGPRRLVRAELATLAKTFAHTAVITPPSGPSGNHVLMAGDSPLALPRPAANDGVVVSGAAMAEFVGDAPVLRDDFAPADQLMTRR